MQAAGEWWPGAAMAAGGLIGRLLVTTKAVMTMNHNSLISYK